MNALICIEAKKFIEKLPDKYNTILGERGTRLSGGQKQRIALARAIARKPEILILDEATSSLVNKSERLIQAAIESLKENMTIIIIAHRLSTVMNADYIYFFENGKVIEKGSFKGLVQQKGHFFELYSLG